MAKSWIAFGMDDALPCPKCGSRDLERNANVIVCMDCDHFGPMQDELEIFCDWRQAINDWNMAAGGPDFWERTPEQLAAFGWNTHSYKVAP